MFAGVATITLNEDNSQVTGLLSKEGEEVWSYSLFFVQVIIKIY